MTIDPSTTPSESRSEATLTVGPSFAAGAAGSAGSWAPCEHPTRASAVAISTANTIRVNLADIGTPPFQFNSD